jgi:spermidine/putrescine transport system ATP-binding protein
VERPSGPTGQEYAVELRDVTKRFGELAAVDAASLAVRPGEFFSLLGPSGCGKTTTLRLLAGFEHPDAGEIRLLGRRANELRPYERPVSMVFQTYALFPHLSVGRNVAFGLERRKVPRPEIERRVRRALELVRLPGFEDRDPAKLSGGQRQRVALARALVLDPPILLLDEPLGALDAKLRKEMQLELKSLQRSLGTTFVYVTHDQEEALTMSDRIAVMHRGRIEQVGTPDEIYERPRTRFVAEFIGLTNVLDAVVRRATGGQVELEAPGWGTLVLPAPAVNGLVPGAAVQVSVRPERCRLWPAGGAPPGWHTAPGTVAARVYLGDELQYRVELGAGGAVTVAVRNDGRSDAGFRPGDPVVVGWRPEDGSLLPPVA